VNCVGTTKKPWSLSFAFVEDINLIHYDMGSDSAAEITEEDMEMFRAKDLFPKLRSVCERGHNRGPTHLVGLCPVENNGSGALPYEVHDDGSESRTNNGVIFRLRVRVSGGIKSWVLPAAQKVEKTDFGR
jgi:hypothetical protein